MTIAEDKEGGIRTKMGCSEVPVDIPVPPKSDKDNFGIAENAQEQQTTLRKTGSAEDN